MTFTYVRNFDLFPDVAATDTREAAGVVNSTGRAEFLSLTALPGPQAAKYFGVLDESCETY
ncbi:hypothetical protein ACIP2Y_08490 [Streptomyces sviceus]|uniref:hypothetical protein n=1 Tax=Streptomyces sviceus TaxID=285530 RepID=UPI00382BD9B6